MFYLKKNPFIIRQIKTNKKEVFLTFDDGPDLETTGLVLDLLHSENWQATFFVVGYKAQAHKNLIERMLKNGHSVMSHSVDHAYSHYFKDSGHLKNWIQRSLMDLHQMTHQEQKAFRPPAGILTPPLVRAAQELQVPLVLWKHRFFDSNRTLSIKKIEKNLNYLSSGDIVLLHDHQAPHRRTEFISSLRHYVQKMKKDAYVGSSLTNEILFNEIEKNF